MFTLGPIRLANETRNMRKSPLRALWPRDACDRLAACACSHADRGCARLRHKGYGGHTHDDLGFASGAPSGWNGFATLRPCSAKHATQGEEESTRYVARDIFYFLTPWKFETSEWGARPRLRNRENGAAPNLP